MPFATHDETYPPLISPESPSYERAWREFAQPVSERDAEVTALLSRLSEAEQNAARVCIELLAAVEDESLVDVLRDRGAVHAARRQGLAKLIERIGGSAPTDAETRDILVEACDAAPHATSDADAKRVVRTLRSELHAEYAAALQNPHLTQAQRSALASFAPPAAS